MMAQQEIWQQHFLSIGHGGTNTYQLAMDRCSQRLAELFASCEGPYSGTDPLAVRESLFKFSLNSDSTKSLYEIIDETASSIARHSIIVQHPNCIAHLHTPPLLAGIAAERFISAQNQSLDSWDQSGGATYVEQRVCEWMCKLFGYSDGSDGVFTSGGTQGNIMALLIARDRAVYRHSKHNIQLDGLPDYYHKLRIVGSTKSHFTLKKGAAILGLGERAVVEVDSNADGSMCVLALKIKMTELVGAGLIPFIVVGTAGTTDHGAIDNLKELGDIARQYSAWFHVDAAYGGALILSSAKDRLAGIEHADSIIVDFHKLWFQPISCGSLLLKNADCFRHLLHRANYLNRETDDLPNLVDKSISATRRFDALKVWMTLRSVGADTLGEMVNHLMAQTQSLEILILNHPNFELLAPTCLTTILFRFNCLGSPVDLDLLNRELRTTLLKRGVAVLGETKVNEVVGLKLTLLNPCLSWVHLEKLIKSIEEYALAILPNYIVEHALEEVDQF
jgi:L-2,4-diaminobutyrate decarboxylase